MAYQGISPYLYRNNLTNVQLLDDISASFNGTTTQFNLTTNGSPFHAVSARSLLIILGGIVQEPDSDYTVSAGVITFTTAPASGLTFAARNIYGLNRLTGINDGLVTPASLSLGGPEWDTSGNLTVDGNITQTGDTNNVYINTDTPTVRPTLDLNFERDQRLDSRITFSRNSTATYLGSDGLIKTALAGEPRFEFDTDGNCLGLLIEESRTNYFDYSESTTWQNYNGGQTNLEDSTLGILSPTGSTPLVLRPTNTSITSLLNDRYEAYPSSGGTMIFSVFVKTPPGSQYEEVQLYVSSVYAGIFSASLIFNISTLTTRGATGTAANAGIFDYGNGWYRVCMSFTCPASTSGPIQRVTIVDDAVAQGTTQSNGLLIFGYQLELGAFATSYIPTSGSTVTRSADNASITGTNFTDWYNATEGTIFTESRLYSVTSTQNFTEIQIDDGTQSNRIFHYIAQSDDKAKFQAWGSDTLTPNTVTPGIDFKHSSSYNSQSYITCLDGQLSSEENTGTQVSLTEAHLGYNHSNNYLNGHLKQLTYYPQRLSNDQLQNLTS